MHYSEVVSRRSNRRDSPGIGSLHSLVVRNRPVGRCLGHRSPFARLGDAGRARSVGALASSFRVVGPRCTRPAGSLG